MIVGILRQGYLESANGSRYTVTQDAMEEHCLTEADYRTVIIFRADSHNYAIESTFGITGAKCSTLEQLKWNEPGIRRVNRI